MQRATFTLDEEALAFLGEVAGNNKSAYINRLLQKEKRQRLEQAIQKANQEEAEDPEYQIQLAPWETTSSDGLTE